VSGLHVTRLGSGPRVVFVHGSMGGGTEPFATQLALADRYTLDLIERRGFGRSPARDDRVDFEADAADVAAQLAGGAHLVGHSYGGVVSLLATALRPAAVRSLTVIEPPAFAVAAGDPAVDRLVARLRPLFPAPGAQTPEAFYGAFLRGLGYQLAGDPALSDEERGEVRPSMTERPPWEARIPFDALRQSSVPVLVVRGDWAPNPSAREIAGAAFRVVAERIAAELRAELVVVPGQMHQPQRDPAFNDRLVAFWAAARD